MLGELVARRQAEGWQPTARNATRIGTLAPEAVLRAVAVRLMRLSDDAAGVARAVAILGDDAQLRHVAALTGRDPDRVAAAADALAAGEILRPAGPGVLRFAHPLLASAVYADVGAGERAALHRRAAEILREEDISAERVAAHLLPSAGSGEALGRRRAVRRGGARARRSARRSRPPATCAARSTSRRPARRAPRSCASSACSEAATDLPTAIVRLEEALAAAIEDRERAHTLLVLGRARSCNGDHPQALAAFEAGGGDRRAPTRPSSPQARAEAIALGLLAPASRGRLLEPGAIAGASRRAPSRRATRSGCCWRRSACARRWPATRCDAVRALAASALEGDAPLPTRAAGPCSSASRWRCTPATSSSWNDRVLSAAMVALPRARVDDGVRDGEPAARRVALGAGAPRRGDGRRRAGRRRRALRLAPLPAGRLRHARQPARRPRRARAGGATGPRAWTSQSTPARRCWRRGTRRSGAWRSSSAARPTRSSTSRAWRDAVAGVRNPASFAALALGVGARADGAGSQRRGPGAGRRGARAGAPLRRAAGDLGRAARGRARRRAWRPRRARSRC